jgi:hypothetical protein
VRNPILLWIVALAGSVLIAHYVPGPFGAWLTVVMFAVVFDRNHRISWRPWWRTVLRGAASLMACLLVAYLMADEAEPPRDTWSLTVAMLSAGFAAVCVYRLVERWRSGSPRDGLTA